MGGIIFHAVRAASMPFRSGIEMSITMTSGVSSLANLAAVVGHADYLHV